MTTAIEDLEKAYVATQAARQEAKTKNTDQANKEDIVDRLLTQLASYVESVAGNDEKLTVKVTRVLALGNMGVYKPLVPRSQHL